MINEWEEFCAYTGTVSYTASKKSDTTWLGRFTFATILEFEGMARILTILARGYLSHGKDGAVISGDPHTIAFVPRLNSRLRNRKLMNAIKHLARYWANWSVGWCSRSSTQKTVLRRRPPSTALSLDLNWRGNSP